MKQNDEYKKFIRNTVITITIGVLLLTAGFAIYLCCEPVVGIDYRNQLVVSNGSLFLLSGLLLFLVGIYSFCFRRKVFEQKIKSEEDFVEYIKKEEKKYRKLHGYPIKNRKKNKKNGLYPR